MISFQELKDSPHVKKLKPLLLLGVLVWVLGFVILFQALGQRARFDASLADVNAILQASAIYHSFPNRQSVKKEAEEPLTAISRIVEEGGMRDRLKQLASNPSGIVVQLDNLYATEFVKFLEGVAALGLVPQNIDLRAVPKDDERLLSVSVIVGSPQ